MSYKFIALDIDGTLTNDKKVITPRTKEALMKAQKMGKKVCLATGRHPHGVIPYAKELELEKYGGYLLCFNGGIVVEVTENGFKTVYSKELPNEFIPKVYEIVKNSNITVNTYTDDAIIANTKVNAYTNIEPEIIGLPFKPVKDFVKYVDFPINKLLLAGEPEEINKYEKILKYYLDGQVDVFKSTPFFLEVVPLGVSKGASLDPLLKSMCMTRDNLIACGDSFNDITMIGYAGLGVAMENGEEEVKKVANYIAPSNNDDGVGYVVEEFMLKDEIID